MSKDEKKKMTIEHYFCDSCKKEIKMYREMNKVKMELNERTIFLDLCDSCYEKLWNFIKKDLNYDI